MTTAFAPGFDPEFEKKLNDLKQRWREEFLKDYTNEALLKHDLDEVDKALRHEGRMKDILRLQEMADQVRILLERVPNLLLNRLQSEKFTDAEQRAAEPYRQVGACFDAVRQLGRHRPLSVGLKPAEYNSRSIGAFPARSYQQVKGGEELIFQAIPPAPGHLSIFNLGTSGSISMLLPNDWERDREVSEGEIVRVPGRRGDDWYKFGRIEGAPFGVEIIRAFVTPEPIADYIRYVMPLRSFVQWDQEQGTRMFEALAEKLKAEKRPWALGEFAFEMVPC